MLDKRVSVNDRVLKWVRDHKWRAPWKAGGAIAVAAGLTLVAFNSPHGPADCERNPLRHVYSPQRLQLLEACKTTDVTVIGWRHEQDGDWHVNVRPDDGTLVNGMNIRRQHGLLVLEWVPGDPRPARFRCGQRLRVTGAYVLDRQHGGWAEIHPVSRFEELDAGACTQETKAAAGALAPPTEEGER